MATTPNLPGALRAAALLVEQLGYEDGITWGGTNRPSLHARNTGEYQRLTNAMPGGEHTIQVGSDYECARYEVTLAVGLIVTVFGPWRDRPADQVVLLWAI